MNNSKNNLLTPSQVTGITYGAIVGVSILNLSYDLVKIASQDGWISAAIGGLYPLYLVLLACFMSKRHPKEDILALSKKYFGKILGTIYNILFMLFFFIYLTSIISGFTNAIRIYIVAFLSKINIFAVLASLSLYLSYKGLKAIGRVNEVLFYLSILLALIPLATLKYGSILNVSPIFGSGLKNIITASLTSSHSYFGMEIIFLIYPYINDNKKIKSSTLKAMVFVIFVYTLLTFLTIYYLGPDIVIKSLWPTIIVAEGVKIPVISTFRFVFMFFWSVTVFRTIADFYYSIAYILHNTFNKIDMKLSCFLLYPLAILIPYIYKDEVTRRKIMSRTTPYLTLFSLITISLLCIIILIKDRKKG